MRFGYAFWGFLGDYKVENGREVSTPDGNATYSWSILSEVLARGWEVHTLHRNRDLEGHAIHGRGDWASFATQLRVDAYFDVHLSGHLDGERLPQLDVLLVEWRWPIPGRNSGIPPEHPDYQPDLDRQTHLLEVYKARGTKIILWDLDHKLEAYEEERWKPDAIFETSVDPIRYTMARTRVEPPTYMHTLRWFQTMSANPLRKLAYIGSRYERDDVITQYIRPVSDRWPGQVEFHGNWLKSLVECQKLWPNVSYHDRCTVRDFRKIYGEAVACPLLAKRSYFKSGFVTPRIWEALMFGCIPVGFQEHRGIDEYLPRTLIAKDSDELGEIVDYLAGLPVRDRDDLRKQLIDRIGFMAVEKFVDRIEMVATGAIGRRPDAIEDKVHGDEDHGEEETNEVQPDGRSGREAGGPRVDVQPEGAASGGPEAGGEDARETGGVV